MSVKKTIYIIAGPNGAGKTTFALSSLKKIFGIDEFVNADEIAKGISPLNPEAAALGAGKIMLSRIQQLVGENKSFALETTLAGRNYVKYIKKAHEKNYLVVLIFLWLDSPKTAIKRVAERVKKGGHNVPEKVVTQRYSNGLKNLSTQYADIADATYIIDNTSNSDNIFDNMIAEKTSNSDFKVYNQEKIDIILNYAKK